jgi:hypothetical protein
MTNAQRSEASAFLSQSDFIGLSLYPEVSRHQSRAPGLPDGCTLQISSPQSPIAGHCLCCSGQGTPAPVLSAALTPSLALLPTQTPEALQPSMLEWPIHKLKGMIQDKLWYDISPFGWKGQILALEFGWGGGISDSGDSPATTGWQVASNSWVSRRRASWPCCDRRPAPIPA